MVIPVPFHTTIEEFCSQYIGICPVEHTPLNDFDFVDSWRLRILRVTDKRPY